MIKLEIDEKFEELSNLYDLFENITRIDYVPLEYREEIKKSLIKAYKDGNQEFEKIHEKLKRLEEINKVWHDNEPMESVDINGKHLQDLYDYNEELFNKNLELDKKVIELEKENQQLKEAYTNVNEELHCAFARGIDSARFDILEENEKLKKAIEILSNYICVRNPLDEDDTYYLSALFSNEEIDKQTHDLLKEVLE